MKILLGVLTAFAILGANPASGQTFSTPVQVSMTAGAHSPSMHVGRDGTIFVSWFQANADIYFSRSADGGATFTAPVHASRQMTTNQYTSLLQRAPEFVIDPNGTIHMIWMESRIKQPVTKQEQSDIWYMRSTDNGSTWSTPLSIMDLDDSSLYAQDFPAIACDSTGNLYVSYLDNRYLMRGTYKHYRMHLERSTDHGATWSLPVIADKLPFENSGTCECCRQDIAVSRDGHVYIGFRTNMTVAPSDDKRDIFVCRSKDGGRTFDSSIRVQLGDWKLDGCPTKGPHVSLDQNENLHVAWNDARDDTGKLVVYYSMLRQGDASILPNYSLSSSTRQQGTWPDVTFGSGGLTACVFMPELNGLPVQLTYSSDGGNSWTRSKPFPGSAGDDQELPIIQFDQSGNLLAVWQDGDKDGILFTKGTGLSPAATPMNPTPTLTQRKDGTVRIGWSSTRPLPFAWYSLVIAGPLGADTIVTRDTMWSRQFAPGAYQYSLRTFTSTGTNVTPIGSFSIESAGVTQHAIIPIAIYPNPAHNGKLVLSAAPLFGEAAQIRLLDVVGRVVWESDFKSLRTETIIPVQGLLKGNYQCEVATGNQTYRVAVSVE